MNIARWQTDSIIYNNYIFIMGVVNNANGSSSMFTNIIEVFDVQTTITTNHTNN